ncbi:hypothetical protein Hanom_Chr04g00299481 [Helianthus anomalus]
MNIYVQQSYAPCSQFHNIYVQPEPSKQPDSKNQITEQPYGLQLSYKKENQA